MMGCVQEEGCTFLERPRRRVVIPDGFWVSSTEVTVEAFRLFSQANGLEMPEAPGFNPEWERPNEAMVNVTWDQARDYCDWVGGRLPTEAEWEYLARGGHSDLQYPWGNDLTHEYANFNTRWQEEASAMILRRTADVWEYVAPVGQFPPNAFGVFDVTGNVEEWTEDCFVPLAGSQSSRTTRQTRAGPDCPRTVKGGSWRSASADLLRLSFRYGRDRDEASINRGFRCVLPQ